MVSESVNILTNWVQSLGLLLKPQMDLPPALVQVQGFYNTFLTFELAGLPIFSHIERLRALTSLDIRFQFILLTSIIPLVLTFAVLICFHEMYLICWYLLLVCTVCSFFIFLFAGILSDNSNSIQLLGGNMNVFFVFASLISIFMVCCICFSCCCFGCVWIRRKIFKCLGKLKVNKVIRKEGQEIQILKNEIKKRRHEILEEEEEINRKIEETRRVQDDFNIVQLGDMLGEDNEETIKSDNPSSEKIRILSTTEATTPIEAQVNDDKIFVPGLAPKKATITMVTLDEEDERKSEEVVEDQEILFMQQRIQKLERTDSFKMRRHELFDLNKRRDKQLRCHCAKFCKFVAYSLIILIPSLFLARILKFEYFGWKSNEVDPFITNPYFIGPGILGILIGFGVACYNIFLCSKCCRKFDYRQKQTCRRHALKYIFLVISVCYTPMITAVFGMFVCQNISCPAGTYLPTKLSLLNVQNLISTTSGSDVPFYCLPCTFHEACNCTSAQNFTICPESDNLRLVEDPTLRCLVDIAPYFWFPSILFAIVWMCYLPCFYCTITRASTKKMKVMDVEFLQKKNVPLWIRSRGRAKRARRVRAGKAGCCDLTYFLWRKITRSIQACWDCFSCSLRCCRGVRAAKMVSDTLIYEPYSKNEKEEFLRKQNLVNDILCLETNHLNIPSTSSDETSSSITTTELELEEREDLSGFLQSVTTTDDEERDYKEELEEGGEIVYISEQDDSHVKYDDDDLEDNNEPEEPVEEESQLTLIEEDSKKKKKKKKKEKGFQKERMDAPVVEVANGLPYTFETYQTSKKWEARRNEKKRSKLRNSLEQGEKWKIRNILTKNSTKALYSTYNYKHRYFRNIQTLLKILLVGTSVTLILYPRVSVTVSCFIHFMSLVLYCCMMPYIDRKLDCLIILVAISSTINAAYLLLPAYGINPTDVSVYFIIMLNMLIPIMVCFQFCWDCCYYRRQERKYKTWMKRLKKAQKEEKINQNEKVKYKKKKKELLDVDELLVRNAAKKVQCLFLFLGIVAIICGSSSLLGFFYGIFEPEYIETNGAFDRVVFSDCDSINRVDFAKYETWDEFTENCCCRKGTHHEGNLILSAEEVEMWSCANGEMKEKVRVISSPFSDDSSKVVNGTVFREFCSKDFIAPYIPELEKCDRLRKVSQGDLGGFYWSTDEEGYVRKYLW